MENKISKLIKAVTASCAEESFEYHEWFVTYHLKIVEEISLSLTKKYPEANRDLIQVLAWTHDYSKPFAKTKEEEKETLLPMVRELLESLSFEETFIEQVLTYLEEVESKDVKSLEDSPIEVKIVSSADGASHFFGPFFSSYFRDTPSESIEKTMSRVIQKAQRDWDRKIVLPEAKDLVESRYRILLENMSSRD